MSDKMIAYAEATLITGSTIFSISNIYSVIGIIVLVLDVILIGFKIYQAVKSSMTKGTTIDLEQSINEAKDILNTIQKQLPKEDNDGGQDTE